MTIAGTYEESYVVLHHALYMCPNDYVLHACNVPSNLTGQFCVDIMLVTTSGSTAAAGGNSKKSTGWWRRQKVDKTIINYTVADICKFV